MSRVRNATKQDESFWLTLDRHLPAGQFDRKIRDGQAYIIEVNEEPVGLLRWNLFWDSVPFCTLLYVEEKKRKKGCGRELMVHWEREMKAQGYGMVMVSTQVDEDAQHFYRKLGYRDAGGFIVEVPGYEQPMELILCKGL